MKKEGESEGEGVGRMSEQVAARGSGGGGEISLQAAGRGSGDWERGGMQSIREICACVSRSTRGLAGGAELPFREATTSMRDLICRCTCGSIFT